MLLNEKKIGCILKESIYKLLTEEDSQIEIYYHGGDASNNLWYHGVLWLTPEDYYAKEYAKIKKHPTIWEIKIDESLLKVASLYDFSDDFDPYDPDMESIEEVKKEGYNCYCMDYDSYNAEGLVLFDNTPIISIRKLSTEEYNMIKDWED